MTKRHNKSKKIKIGVYQLKAFPEFAKFVEKGYVKLGKNFNDDVIDLSFLNKDKIKFDVDSDRIKFNDEVYFQFYKDNVSSSYFSKTARIPVFHCSVMFSKNVILANLINIYLYFTIDDAKSFTSFNQLVSSEIKGTYELVIEYSNKEDKLSFDKFVSYEDLVYDIIEMLSSETMNVMIEQEIVRRNEERIKQYGKVDDYEIPNKVISFDEMLKKYEASNNMDEVMEMFK